MTTKYPFTPVDRSAENVEFDGRHLSIKVLSFDTKFPVQDAYGKYLEEYERSAFNVSLATRGEKKFPLLVNHNKSEDPIGSVQFIAKPDALYAEADVARNSKRGDLMLELVESGSVSGVSIGAQDKRFTGIKNGFVKRSEMAIRELSLTAFPQLDGEVLTVRSEIDQEIADFAALLQFYKAAA